MVLEIEDRPKEAKNKKTDVSYLCGQSNQKHQKKILQRQSNHEHDKGERQSVEQATVDAEKNDKSEGGRPEAAVQPRLSPVVEQFAKLGHRRPEGDNDDAREGTLQKKCCLKVINKKIIKIIFDFIENN